ncbi:MAG: cyclase family protein [Actinobacteria bacterium]|jgi:kynurenine formamidase|nr:cyclase family protein [Actinomycetota bacterium]
MEVVDLTAPLCDGMPGYPGDPRVAIDRVRSHETDGYQVTQVSLGSHSGTHLDAPRHFFRHGPTLDGYPVNRFVGPGLVVDCRVATSKSVDGAREMAGPSLIDTPILTERLTPYSVPSGGFVLLWMEGALLAPDAARSLLKAGATLVGTDGPSLDAPPYPVHRLLLGHGVLLAENLRGLERLGPGPVMCAFLPLALPDADGAPVRAVAWR